MDQVYHWNTGPHNYLVMGGGLDEARRIVLANIEKWRHQDPATFDADAEAVRHDEPFVAGRGYVISASCERVPW